jgi:hypothetical protein
MRTIISIIFLFMLLGCKEDKLVAVGQIGKIESSKTISLGQSDIITVTYTGGSSGCSGANHLESEIIGNTIIFKGYYHYPIKPTVCPATAPNHILQYVFKPSAKGTYTYKSFDTEVSATTVVN